MSTLLLEFCLGSALRVPGNDERGDDIGQHAAAAQGAEHHPAQADEGGIDIEILRDAASHAVQHLVLIGFIQSLFHNVSPLFR